jgi:prevent-host-death family protein
MAAMTSLHVSEDIVSLSDFKNNASKMLRLVRASHRPVVITQNGKAAGVLISPADFDQLTERARFVSAVEAGMSDAREGKLVSDEDLSGALDEALLD